LTKSHYKIKAGISRFFLFPLYDQSFLNHLSGDLFDVQPIDMRKLISWIVLIALLFIIPFGSWYYLKQGLDYRKTALEDLVTKGLLPEMPDSINVFRGKTTLLVFESTNDNDILQPIFAQFKDAYTFQMAGISGNHLLIEVDSSVLDNLKLSGKTFALIDTAGNIRNYYTTDREQLKSMVEHLAVILPQPKEKDVKMKK
jgi:hypothetical protein